MACAKVVFPPPPPTTNTLTPEQRARLIKSTKKIGRILGTTPHLVDTSVSGTLGPVHVNVPVVKRNDSRVSFDSYSTTDSWTLSTHSLVSSSHGHSSCASYSSASSASSKHSSVYSRKGLKLDVLDPWPSKQPPILRLALPNLDTIPASPFPISPSSPRGHSRSASLDSCDFESGHFTIHPPTPTESLSSPQLPSFVIPSASTERRRKVERLRKKLGEDVLFDMIFALDSDSEDRTSSEGEEEDDFVLSPAPTLRRPRPKNHRRIARSRDSIAFLSPHRAQRRISASKVSRPALPASFMPGRQLEQAQWNAAEEKAKDRLCSIVESPEEHGSGCSEEFGWSRRSSESRLSSEWYDSDTEADRAVWSTRRGYAGW